MPPLAPTPVHPTTTLAAGRNIPWLLTNRAAQRPDHAFLVWEPFDGPSRTWSYREFDHDVRRLADGLRRRGTTPGDKVVIHLENCPEFLLSWFACAYIGAVAVCTNTRSSAMELAYFGEHSEAVAAITQPRLATVVQQAMPGIRWIAITARDADASGGSGPAPERSDTFDALFSDLTSGVQPAADAFDPAWIQYTSGTTSRPKAVVLTHANALWGAKISAAHESLTQNDVHFVHLPLFHINALCYSTLATLWAGGTAVLAPRFSASRFWDVALRNRCTWLSLIPFVARALGQRPVPRDHSFRLWGYGYTAPEEDRNFSVRTLGWYGMTETVTHAIMDEAENPGRPYCMGRPTPEYDVAVRRDDGSVIGPGETGSIFVRGVPGLSLFAGYLHDGAATADAVDPDGWLRTGDRATLSEDGFLAFADRSKDMLKVGGENVAASEIERVILGVPGVKEVAVVGGPHPMLDEVPIAFLIADGEHPTLAADVSAACAGALADFKVPAEVRIVAELPRSTLDKIAKADLRQSLYSERDANVSSS